MEEWGGERTWLWAAGAGWAGWLLLLGLCGGKKAKGKAGKDKNKDDGTSKDVSKSKEDAPADYIDMGIADRLPKELK